MQAKKPKLQRVYVEARDPTSKARECFVLYNASPADVRRKLGASPKKKRSEAAA